MLGWKKIVLVILLLCLVILFISAPISCPWLKQKDDSGSSATNFLVNKDINFLAINPSSVLYVSTKDGLYKSVDNGTSWTELIITDGDLIRSRFGTGAIGISPSNPDITYVIVWGPKICKSTDGGATWVVGSNYSSKTIGIDPTNPDIVYLYSSSYILKTTNGGTTWSQYSLVDNITGDWIAECSSLAIDPSNSNIIYAGGSGTSGARGIFKSNDGGGTWSRLDTISPLPSIDAIAINPVATNIIYVGSSTGTVYKSSDGGTNWIDTGLIADVNGLVIDPSNPDIIYATSMGQGVFKSTDGGTNWSATNNGLTTLYIYPLAINPISSNIIYCVGKYILALDLFKSTDGGMNWAPLN